MADRDDTYVAVRRGALSDLLELADHAGRQLAMSEPQIAACLNGAVAEIRSDIRELV